MTRRAGRGGRVEKRRRESGTTGQKDREKEKKKSGTPDIKERKSGGGGGDGGGSHGVGEQASKGERGRGRISRCGRSGCCGRRAGGRQRNV